MRSRLQFGSVLIGILGSITMPAPSIAQELLAYNSLQKQPFQQEWNKPDLKTLDQVLREIEKKHAVSFICKSDLLNLRVEVNSEFTKGKQFLPDLQKMLRPHALSVKQISNRQFAVSEKSGALNSVGAENNNSSRNTGEANTQIITAAFDTRSNTSTLKALIVSGKVVTSKNTPLQGVNVSLKGTASITATDAEGNFSLNVPGTSATLIFSYIGYQPVERVVSSTAQITVTMIESVGSMDEVVVVGYGTQRKENLTGAVSTINAKQLDNRPVANLATALQGLAPGLSITRTTGQPGDEGIGIQVRGVTSANGNVDPLVVLDGVASPGVTLQTLNVNDIESISVLKDAAAAAIYGAQAAGGVILITTKKGRSGKTVFNYSSLFGVDKAINLPQRMETWQEAEYVNLAYANAGSGRYYTPAEIQFFKDGTTPYVLDSSNLNDYRYYNTESVIDQVIRKNTAMQTHNISARGGTDKMNFLASFGAYDKQGMFKVGPDANRRYNARLNFGAQLSKHLSIDSRLSYTNQLIESSSSNVSGNGGALLHSLYRNSRQRFPTFTPEGRYNNQAALTYAQLESGGYNNFNRNFFDGTFTLRLAEVVKGLNIRAVYGAQHRLGNREIFRRSIDLWNRVAVTTRLNNPNSYEMRREQETSTNLQFLADQIFNIGKNHQFKIMGGYQFEDFRTDNVNTVTSNLVSNDLPSLVLGDNTTKTNTQSIGTYAFQSAFGRFNYSYDNKYLFEATVRMDESSRLAPGKRSKIFPAASVGWNVHREDWFQDNIPVFSEFKLRGSWGRLGNARGIGNYDYLALLTRGDNVILGTPEIQNPYFYQNTVPSTQLSWESIETFNGGLDLGLFQGKLQLTADYYVKFNRNMLTNITLPATFGAGTPRVNNGELKSWGWETELRFRDRIGKDFNYNVSFNISDNQNRVTSFEGRRVVPAGIVSILEGYPLNTLWGYQSSGYFSSADEVSKWAFQDSRAGVGDVRYIDQNGDGRITVGRGNAEDHGDLVYMGTNQARYLFGFNLGMEYKGFDFSVFFQGVGARRFMPSQDALVPMRFAWQMPLSVHNDHWTAENPNALFPRPFLYNGGAAHNYLTSDKWILNARYMRLKNLQVGYTLPQSLMKKIKVSNARIFYSGQDLFTISSLGGFQGYFDPEQQNDVGSAYPFFSTSSFGINITF